LLVIGFPESQNVAAFKMHVLFFCHKNQVFLFRVSLAMLIFKLDHSAFFGMGAGGNYGISIQYLKTVATKLKSIFEILCVLSTDIWETRA
jgi:hypothetical protein